MQKADNFKRYLIIVTGIMVGFPAFITDLYLPAFTSLTDYFNTTPPVIQMSLMATMIGIALGQLIIGSLSDRHGRKIPLIISLAIFIVTTFCSICTKDVKLFILYRFVQGLACSSGTVLSRAILTDVFTGSDLSKALSVNTAVLGLSPSIAPVIGGVILLFVPWQGVYFFMFSFGIILLLLCLGLKETHTREKRELNSSIPATKTFAVVLKKKVYLSYVMIFGFSMAVMFAYISSSPFIFQNHYSLSPLSYSIVFGFNALALSIGAVIAGRYKDQLNALGLGIAGLIIMAIIAAMFLLLDIPFIFFEASIFTMFIFNGMTYPSSTTLALETNRANAGTASSLLGAMAFLMGGLISPLVGIGNILFSTSVAIVSCSVVAGFLLLRLRKQLCVNYINEIPVEEAELNV